MHTHNLYMNYGFMKACANGELHRAKQLYFMNGPDINARDRHGYTALMFACIHGHLPIAKWINEISNGNLDINQTNWYGMTPFMMACHYGHLPIVQWIYNTFKNVMYHDNYLRSTGKTAYMMACSSGHLDIVQWLYSVYKGKPNIIDARDHHGNTAFLNACYEGHLSIVKWLYSVDNLHICIENIHGDNAFRIACGGNYLSMAKWLYSKIKFVDFGRVFDCVYLSDEVLEWLIDIGGVPDMDSKYYPYYEERREKAVNKIKRWWKYQRALRNQY